MLSTVRRHSLRLQTELHRWSICDPGNHLLPDRLLVRVPACISRSKSCTSSAGESDGSRGSWSSSDSVISTDSAGEAAKLGSPYRVVLLGASGVGKTAFSSIFAGAADSMDSDDCELCGGKKRYNHTELLLLIRSALILQKIFFTNEIPVNKLEKQIERKYKDCNKIG